MNTTLKIIKAIKSINPNAQFTFGGDNLDTITWVNGTTPISKSDIQSKITEIENQYNADEYKRSRAAEYPSLAEQLDDIYHNGIDGWRITIQAIKDKYPKE